MLSADRCDGCGLCQTVCPTQAISGVAVEPARRMLRGREVRLVACGQSVAAGTEGRIPCLHALGVRDLLGAWAQGCGNWLVAHGDCDACPCGAAERLATRVERLNALLRERGLPAIAVKVLPSDRWIALVQSRQLEPAGQFDAGRRRCLTLYASDEATKDERVGPGRFLPGDGALPWCIDIAPEACEACHACARICPADAIVYEAVGDAEAGTLPRNAHYRFEHARCTGCGLCVDVCPTQAIRLSAWVRPRQVGFELRVGRCARCGVSFAWPQDRTPAPRLCPICARGQHKRRLYQVMD